MNPTDRRVQIMDEIAAAYGPLEAQVAALSAAQLTQPGVMGEWTVKDVLAHVAWWERHLLRTLRAGHDELDELMTEGMDSRQATDRTNAEVFAANRDRPLADVLAEFRAAHEETLAALAGWPEDELARDEVYEAIGWDTFRHYPDHTALIQAWREGAGQ
jgi:uncharacterized protein (TIGR03083 family)